jgi:hypothetical protein
MKKNWLIVGLSITFMSGYLKMSLVAHLLWSASVSFGRLRGWSFIIGNVFCLFEGGIPYIM